MPECSVINYDVPGNLDNFSHRARRALCGAAVTPVLTLALNNDRERLPELELAFGVQFEVIKMVTCESDY